MARVQLENVKKIYQGNVTAVHDFNLDIADKEFIVFVGPSGCGKSTTLRMVAGLEEISEGTVKIDGNIVNDLQPKDREISMVFQNYALYPHLTVFDNMAFPLRIAKIPVKVERTEKEKADLQARIGAVEANIKEFEQAMYDAALVQTQEDEVAARIAPLQKKIDENQAKIVVLQQKKECRELVDELNKTVAEYEARANEIRPIVFSDEATEEEKKPLRKELKKLEKGIQKTRAKAENPLGDAKVGRINDSITALSFRNAELKERIKDIINRYSIPAQLALLKETKAQLEEDLASPKVIYKKMDQNEVYERVMNAAKVLGITQYLTRKPRALSGGQRQRVAIGRAMVKDCKVFLMDEPLSNLDAKLRNQMRAEIILLRQKIQTTFIYVTHDQTEAMTLGDRIVIMKDGFIMQVGTPEEVFDHPDNLFVAEFIGAPKMNTFRCALRKDGDKYSVNPFGVEIPLNGPKGAKLAEKGVEGKEEIILGIRPEHIALSHDGAGIPVTVQVNEMMGSEVHLHVLTSDGTSLVVRVPTVDLSEEERASLVYGKELHLAFEDKVLHFFDKETEVSLLK